MKSMRLFTPFKNRSFAFKLTSLFLLVFIGVFSVATIILGLKWYDLLAKGLLARGVLMSENAAARINDLVGQAETVGLTYSTKINNTASSVPAPDIAGINGMLSTKTINEHISAIGIVLENTVPGDEKAYNCYYYSTKTLQDGQSEKREMDPLEEKWFLKAGNANKPFWYQPVRLFPDSPEAGLFVAPLFDKKSNRFIGALFVEIPLIYFQQALDKTLMEDEGACILFSGDGKPVTGSSHAQRFSVEQQGRFSRLYKQDSPGNIDYGYLKNINPEGEGAHVFHAYCDNGWEISFTLPGNWVDERLTILFHYIFAIFIVTVPLVVLLTYTLTKRVVGPLTRLTQAAEAIGGGQFNVTLPRYKGNDEIGQLTRSFEQMQRELSVYLEELRKSFKQQENIESELNIAKTIQTGILPKVESAFIDSEPFDLDALLIPAKGVGGDLYDFFFLDESHLVAIVGDVSGKGIPAALFMSVTQTLQRSIAFRFKNPPEIVHQLNRLLMMNNEASMFVTYFIGIIDTCSGEMTYCNAGHNFPIIRRSNGNLETLGRQHGLPLGIYEEDYGCDSVLLNRDDTLIIYTDGITEAFNPHGELFGEIRLKEAIAYSMTSDPRKISQTILEHLEIFIEGHEQSDDITLLTLQMKNTFCPVPSRSKETHEENS